MAHRVDVHPLLARAVLLAILVLVSGAGQAYAHGGFWRVNRIHIAPDDPSRIVLQSDVRGLVSSADGGASWQWVCAEAYGRSSISAGRVGMALAPLGTLLIAPAGQELWVSTAEACGFRQAQGLEGYSALDVTYAGHRALALGLPTAGVGGGDRVFVSADGSAPFSALGAPLPDGFLSASIRETAGGILVAGSNGGALAVARSDRDGASWQLGQAVPVAIRLGWRGEIVDLDDRGELLFVLLDELERADGSQSADALYVSEDGGASLRLLYADQAKLGGFARSPDGDTLLVASALGLFRASLGAALMLGPGAFVSVSDVPFYGLRWTADGVYAGTEEFLTTVAEPFSLGLSRDQGQTFTRVMSVCDVHELGCAQGTLGAQRCPIVFSDQGQTGGGFKEDFLAAPRCEGTGRAATDAGAPVDSGLRPAQDPDASNEAGPEQGAFADATGDPGAGGATQRSGGCVAGRGRAQGQRALLGLLAIALWSRSVQAKTGRRPSCTATRRRCR